MTITEFLSRLNRVQRCGDQWKAKCPGHEDRENSLSVREGRDERILVHCFASCHPNAIVSTLGLRMRDLFPREKTTQRSPSHRRRCSPLEHALAQVLAEARRQRVRLEPHRDLMLISDHVRRCFRAIDETRRVARDLGSNPSVWDALELAAEVERKALAVNAQVDANLGDGRIA